MSVVSGVRVHGIDRKQAMDWTSTVSISVRGKLSAVRAPPGCPYHFFPLSSFVVTCIGH